MALGAVYSWAYLPDVQRSVIVEDYEDGIAPDGSGVGVSRRRRRGPRRRLETRNLEELGEGYQRAKLEGQLITIREKWAHGKVNLWRRLGSAAGDHSEIERRS